jgi:hypothetical protein
MGKKRERNGGAHIWRGKWRASRNGGWEGEFGGVCKMEACLEALLEMVFCTKPPNFGVEARMEAPAGDALSVLDFCAAYGIRFVRIHVCFSVQNAKV